jgi:hypothetical protein
MQQTAQKLTSEVTNEQKKAKNKSKQNKTKQRVLAKLLHTFTNSHAADASAATRRAQNDDNAELALQ